MPIHYLLPCSDCEHQFQLTTSQAGQPLQCPQCDTVIDAPKLGTLKQLPTLEDASTKATAAGNQTAGWKRHVFAIGLMTAVAAGIAGAALYWYSQSLFTPVDVDGHIELVHQELDKCSPAELWQIWHQQTDLEDGLGEWAEPKYMGQNIQSNHLKNFAYGLLGLAGIGVLMLLSSFAMKE